MQKSIKIWGVVILVFVSGAAIYLWLKASAPNDGMTGKVYGAAESVKPVLSASGATQIDIRSIPETALKGFDQCEQSEELVVLQRALMTAGKPLEKSEAIWSFAVDGVFAGLQIRKIEVGVCNINGDRDCGWGSYLGLLIASPIESAKQSLTTKYGIDFTEEKRDDSEEQTMVTLRPILSNRELPANTSRLSCDPGNL